MASLAKRFITLRGGLSIQDGIAVRDKLLEVAAELELRARTLRSEDARELCEYEAAVVRLGAAAIQKFGTEVTRLREGIGCHHYGRLAEFDLYQMSQNWNCP